MPIVEVITLMDTETGRTIVERRHTTDPVVPGGGVPEVCHFEWWSVMAVTVHQDGRPVGQKPVPFRIDATTRAEAFANLERSMHEAAEGAKRQVQQELEEAERRRRPQIVLPGGGTTALPLRRH